MSTFTDSYALVKVNRCFFLGHVRFTFSPCSHLLWLKLFSLYVVVICLLYSIIVLIILLFRFFLITIYSWFHVFHDYSGSLHLLIFSFSRRSAIRKFSWAIGSLNNIIEYCRVSHTGNWELVKPIVRTKFRRSHLCLYSQAGSRLWQLMALLFFVMLW